MVDTGDISNSVQLYGARCSARAEKTKKGQQVQILQNNVALFGQLYISMQNREGDLKDFFFHMKFSPSLHLCQIWVDSI